MLFRSSCAVLLAASTNAAEFCYAPSASGGRSTASTPKFQDVSKAAGLNYEQHWASTAPNCMFDDWQTFSVDGLIVKEDVVESAAKTDVAWDKGGYCMTERSTGAAAVGDYDGDGLPDIFAPRSKGPPILYRNKGDGTFEETTEATGILAGLGDATASTAAWLDANEDGNLDLFVTTIASDRYYFFENDGNGKFKECAIERGLAVVPERQRHQNFTSGQGIAIGDYDLDGHIDIFVGEWFQFYMRSKNPKVLKSHTTLLRNDGKGNFVDMTEKSGIAKALKRQKHREQYALSRGVYTFGATFADLDDDGWPDLLVAGDFVTSRIFWNNKGTFEDSHRDVENGMGSTVADIDNDGKLDWFVSSIYDMRPRDHLTPFGTTGNRMYHNDGGRKISDWTDKLGVRDGAWGWGSAFTDYDNDGDLDLFVTNGFIIPETTFDDAWNVVPNKFWQNDGKLNMKEIGADIGVDDVESGRGVSLIDFDGDGDQDIFVVNYAGKPRLYRNDGGNANDYIRIRVEEGNGQHSIGAIVKVTVGDVTQMRVIGVGEGFAAQSEAVAHFGLGKLAAGTEVEVKVQWPGKTTGTLTITNPKINSLINIKRPETGTASEDVDGQTGKQCSNVAGVVSEETMKFVAGTWEAQQTVTAAESGNNPDDSLMEVYLTQEWDETKKASFNEFNHALVKSSFGNLLKVVDIVAKAPTGKARPISGMGNNEKNPGWGAAMTPLPRAAKNGYKDGKSAPGGWTRPSARKITNDLFHQPKEIASTTGLSEVHLHFGQLLAHDTDHTTPQPNTLVEENFPIRVPAGDPIFDPDNTGYEVIRFRRSIYDGTNKDERNQINKVTSFVDASVVYGSDSGREAELRTFTDGILRTSAGNLLPFNKKGLPNDNPLARPIGSLFLAGDARVNVQPGLTAMHTVWHREHNWLAQKMKIAMTKAGTLPSDPAEADEEIYQRARKINIAEFQIVTYKEYLPATLGEGSLGIMPEYTGYKDDVDPSAVTEFTTAAFRFGHSQINDKFTFEGMDGVPITKTDTPVFQVPLKDFYFLPSKIMLSGGIDNILRQMNQQKAQEVDTYASAGVRNFLFGERNSGGADLVASNIQRGRDHGLPDYNTMRESFGFKKVASFDEITKDAKVSAKLKELYGSVDDVDALVGGLAEDHVSGASVGPLFQKVLSDQFARMRDGDRFWYGQSDQTYGLGEEATKLLESETTQGGVFVRNVNMYTNLYSYGKDHLVEGGANSRKWARNMAKNNLMYVPENFYLWIGGCATHAGCGHDQFCGETVEDRGFFWNNWCQPCEFCEDDEYDFTPLGGKCPRSCEDGGREEL